MKNFMVLRPVWHLIFPTTEAGFPQTIVPVKLPGQSRILAHLARCKKTLPRLPESITVQEMTLEEFRVADNPLPDWSPALRALWLDGSNEWDAAHKTVQDDESLDAARVHAYLHRKEGDLSNASYWYARAGQEAFHGSLEEEWTVLSSALLGR